MRDNLDLLHDVFTDYNIIGVALDYGRGYKMTVVATTSTHGTKTCGYWLGDGTSYIGEMSNHCKDENEVLDRLDLSDQYYEKYPPEKLCEYCNDPRNSWHLYMKLKGKNICHNCIVEKNKHGYSCDQHGNVHLFKESVHTSYEKMNIQQGTAAWTPEKRGKYND